MLNYTGKLVKKGHTISVSDKFQKREFVVTDGAASYPQFIQFQLTQDRCSLLDKANIGDEIDIHFSLKGREWKNPQGEIKFFNSLDAFRVDVSRKQSQIPMNEPYREFDDSGSDLPF